MSPPPKVEVAMRIPRLALLWSLSCTAVLDAQSTGLAPGDQAWVDSIGPAGATLSLATGLANDDSHLLVVGRAFGEEFGSLSDWWLEGYSLQTGASLWSDSVGTIAELDQVTDVVALDGFGYVAGNATLLFSSSKARVQARDVATGAIAWTRDITGAGSPAIDRIDVQGGVVVVPVSTQATIDPEASRVEAFDAATGAPLWTTSSVLGEDLVTHTDVVVREGLAFVSGFENVSFLLGQPFVRALDLATGQVVWSVESGSSAPVPQAMLDHEAGVVVVLHDTALGGPAQLRALEAATGQELWSSDLGALPNFEGFDLRVRDGRVAIVGSSSSGPAIAVFDLSTGAELWSETRGIGGDLERYATVQWSGKRLFAAGTSTDLTGASSTLISAEWNGATGQLRWLDLDAVPGEFASLQRRQSVWFRERFVTCGSLEDAKTSADEWFVRSQVTQ